MLGRTIITTAALATAVALPAAAHAGQDLRSPDARDAAATGAVVVSQDLRSPDTRDAATRPVVEAPRALQDLRSPDVRDAARDIRPVLVVLPSLRVTDSDGFHWGDAGIGAAGMLGLLGILAGTAVVSLHRRRRHRMPIAGAR